MPPRAVIWCAVSSQPQAAEDEISLPQQEQEARDFAAGQGYQVIDLLTVPGFSRRESDVITALDEFAAQGIFAYHKLREHWQRRDFDVLIAYNHSRLGRSSTLHSYVIENTILAGAQVYLIQGGWIGQDSLRFQIALGGVAATTDVDRLVKARDLKMNQYASKGLPTSSSTKWSHKVLRDERGKAIKIVPDEARRPIIDAAGRLLVEGVNWRQIEQELFTRYGYGLNGRAWAPLKFYILILNPQFWGHSARFFHGKNRDFGLWVMEEGHEIPDGVLIYYHTHEAFWPVGHELGDQVRAELHRRVDLPRRTLYRPTRFAGLLICGECNYNLTIANTHRVRSAGYRCPTRYILRPGGATCNQSLTIHENTVQDWLDKRLRAAIQASNPEFWAEQSKSDTLAGQIAALETQIASVEAVMRRALHRQLNVEATDPLYDAYQEEITQANNELKSHKVQLDVLMRRALATSRESRDRHQTFAELSQQGVEAFWKSEPRVINQLLHRLMGKRRLVVLNGQIIGVADAPSRQRNQHP